MEVVSQSLSINNVPYDFSSIENLPNWRENLFWPSEPHELHSHIENSINNYLNIVEATNDEFSKKILLSGPWPILRFIMDCYEKCMCLQFEQNAKGHFLSSSSQMQYLRSDSGSIALKTPPPWVDQITFNRYFPSLNLEYLRNCKKMSKWMPLWKTPFARLMNTATAISYNELLHEQSRKLDGNLNYFDAKMILNKARGKTNRKSLPNSVVEKIEHLAEKVIIIPELDDLLTSRLIRILKNAARWVFQETAKDLIGLSNITNLPDQIWSGTGGNYPARIIGLEIISRGGSAVRFDHGGSSGLTSPAGCFSLSELSVSSKFIMGTSYLAEMSESYCPNHNFNGFGKAKIEGANGFPHLWKLPLRINNKTRKKKKNVIYLSSFSRSDKKGINNTISEIVYVDWSLRLAEFLSTLPINLKCKPHPASFPKMGNHVLSKIADTISIPFEEIMDWADVFVCDTINSTTFWEISCSDKPIIFLNLNLVKINPAIREEIFSRCNVISTSYNNNNLPQFNLEELSDAILDAPDSKDPSTFRKLFMNES